MSYLSGAIPYANVGAGTYAAQTNGNVIAAATSSSTQIGDLVVLVAYMSVSPELWRSSSGGWTLLDWGFDAANGYGLGLWVCIATVAGATQGSLTLYSGSGDTGQMAWTVRPIRPFRFDLVGAVGGGDWYNATADSRAGYFNPYRGAGGAALFAQGISLCAAGCKNNAAAVPTAGLGGNYTERLDSGNAGAPSFNVWLGDRTTVAAGAIDVYTQLGAANFWSATSTKTNRAGVRGFVPVIGNVAGSRGRYGRAGRVWG